MTDQFPHDIDITFEATIIADHNSGWPCVQLAGSSELFGTGKPVKVAGTVDGTPFQATLLPVGGGTHMVPIKAALRKSIGKAVGDNVTVHLEQRFT